MRADQIGQPAEDRSHWIALVVLCVGMLMIVLDVTVVNVALPSIQRDLHFSQANLAWVVNAYLLSFGGLLMLAGRIGDLISRRTVFLCGLAVFTSASVLCGVAQSQALLVTARFVQGVGGAMDVGGDPGDDRHHVPRTARAGEGNRGVQLRRLGGRLDRTPGRRRRDPGARLALDLLHQPARGGGDGRPGQSPVAPGPRHRPGRRSRRGGSRPHHRRPDAGGVHHREAGHRTGLDVKPDHGLRRCLAGACWLPSSGGRRPLATRSSPFASSVLAPWPPPT